MLPPLDAKKNSVCSIFAAASGFPSTPASSYLAQAGAGLSGKLQSSTGLLSGAFAALHARGKAVVPGSFQTQACGGNFPSPAKGLDKMENPSGGEGETKKNPQPQEQDTCLRTSGYRLHMRSLCTPSGRDQMLIWCKSAKLYALQWTAPIYTS